MSALERKVILGFAVALTVLLAIAAVAAQSTLRLSAEAARVKHAQEVLTRLNSLLATATQIQTGQRGFVITGEERFLEPYHAAEAAADAELAALTALIRDPAQRRRLEALRPLIAARRAISRDEIALRRSEGFDAARDHILEGAGREVQQRIRAAIAELAHEEERLLAEREMSTRKATRTTLGVIGAGGVAALLFVAAALVVVHRGFQDRMRFEQALQRSNEELRITTERAQAADRVKSTFLATMSHELRTPLNSIIGFTGILLQELAGPLNPEQRKQLGMVQSSARHLLALINDVLDLSRIEAGELNVAFDELDLRTVIERAVKSVKPAAERKGLALRADVSERVGLIVSDARRVEQVLLNLLSNAIKFTERGEVRLRADVADGEARMEVSDTGVGIKPDDMARLFEPFRQLDTGLTRAHEGTGLGLAICRRLAELLGGAIRARSVWGEGSVFTFALPTGSRP